MARKTRLEWIEAFKSADMDSRAPRKFTAMGIPMNAYEAKILMEGAEVAERPLSDFIRRSAMEAARKLKSENESGS